MGRGRGDADNLFYGDSMETLSESLAQEPPDLDKVIWQDIKTLFDHLRSAKRNPRTLIPNRNGVITPEGWRTIRILEDDYAEDYNCFYMISLGAETGKPVLVVSIYDYFEDGAELRDTIYKGQSVEDALDACRAWTEEQCRPEVFAATPSIVADRVKNLMQQILM